MVIPVLIGLLFELLVVVPLRVPIDESPVFLLYQDWALGLVFLKIWTRLVSSSKSFLFYSVSGRFFIYISFRSLYCVIMCFVSSCVSSTYTLFSSFL